MSKTPFIARLLASAEAAKEFSVSLFTSAIRAIAEQDEQKADKPKAVACIIAISGWDSDNTADYPNFYDIAVSGVTANDRADVMLAPSSLGTAVECGLCQTCETLTGKIRLRAVSVPESAIAAQYWIEQGKG